MDIVERIMRREGWDRYTDRPDDRGGPTKWGITQTSWSGFINRAATVADVKSITEQQARDFYYTEYLSKTLFDLIHDEPLRDFVVDCAVNHGKYRATRWLQTAVHTVPDGKMGRITLDAVNAASPDALILRLVSLRARFYATIASDQLPADPDLPNLQGWINRLSGFVDELATRIEGR